MVPEVSRMVRECSITNKHFLATSFSIVVWQQTGNVWQSGPGLVAIIQMWHHSEEPDVSGNQIKLRPATIATKHYTSPMEQE